ncbi:MAG: flagellar biosynthesis protein FlhB [Treponema sp.]|jgi:flagellar biosynthetic protein FlhB|nr:flagellar biosynthesis protein FlhB [Treponema sp.]
MTNIEQLIETKEFKFDFLLTSGRCLLPVIDLQWFSDEDDEDAPGKTEQPTEQKLRRRREEEGQVPKSQELNGALGLLLPALVLLFFAPSMLRTCVEMIRHFYMRITELDPTNGGVISLIFLRYLLTLVLPILFVSCISAILSNVIQTQGFIFTTKPLVPNFSRTVPRLGQFFKRIFSVDGLYNFGKSIIKMAIIGTVSYILISSEIHKLVNLQKADVWTGFTTVAWIAIKMLLIASLLMLILSIPDYMFQRWRFHERNKMTRYEIKEEMKMYEADPQIQGRIRRRFQELLKQNFAAEVPKADVVITNPTHFAVALKYDRYYMPGPMVLAKGDDELAARIKSIAKKHGVPMVENKPLAQSLFREAEVGQMIDYKYWQTVAEILATVWKLNEQRRQSLDSGRMSA